MPFILWLKDFCLGSSAVLFSVFLQIIPEENKLIINKYNFWFKFISFLKYTNFKILPKRDDPAVLSTENIICDTTKGILLYIFPKTLHWKYKQKNGNFYLDLWYHIYLKPRWFHYSFTIFLSLYFQIFLFIEN